MRNLITTLRKERGLAAGYFLLAISALTFVITDNLQVEDDFFTPFFFIHYFIFVGYGIALLAMFGIKSMLPFYKEVRSQHILLLLLFNISAYALNNTLRVFGESAPWLIYFLIIENTLLAIYALIRHNPKSTILAPVLMLVFTAALIFHFYQAIMVFPVYGIGVIGILFLGISLHVMVPLLYVGGLIVIIIEQIKNGTHWIWHVAGMIATITLITFFSYRWHEADTMITENRHQFYKPGEDTKQIPEWITLSQKLKYDSYTEKYLKSGLVYQEFIDFTRLDWFGNGLRFEGQRYHDPLVAVASLIVGRPTIDRETRISILNYAYDARHETVDRFWSGINLKTSDIITNIKLFPAFRMAYTESIIFIKNEKEYPRNRWFTSEEAIYTFQMPEGSVVTSLSLWINGKEELARLTTKSKAEKAYNTIVGREMRDPSVVYWMEGNKVRVRVFPCTPGEDRQFKIGITSPLEYTDNKLAYHSINFKGPDYSDAHQSVNILFDSPVALTGSSLDFRENGDQWEWSGDYDPEWYMEMDAPEVSKNSFSFNNETFTVAELSAPDLPFDPEVIYLDINDTWTTEDISEVLALAEGRKVYINSFMFYEIKDIAASVAKISDSRKPNFSLFPFHKIEAQKKALVITKGDNISPNLDDLKGTGFQGELFEAFKNHQAKYFVFDLGSKPSDYIRSLKEFNVLHYTHGNTDDLKSLLAKKAFPVLPDDVVCIPIANISISKTDTSASGKAPDHLLRLFAYNQLLEKIGRNYFNEDFLNNDLIKVAEVANIVSPVSSLIVLETQNDYERFDIDENKESLGNANLNSSGAVPEPHEWALIIAGLLFVAIVWLKKRRISLS